MMIIFKIARNELRNLFYSPIAWFLMIVFFIQCAMTYMGFVEQHVQNQEMGGNALKYMSNLTGSIFYSEHGLFASVMQNLYLYVPLLTMGLISREINGGTIKLLYSSPLRIWQIVFGKYLAMMVFSLVLVLVAGVFIITAIFQVQSVDVLQLVSAALGLFLLLCAYSAIGLFMSGLTNYQVVAAVSSFVMIGILSYIGRLWQEYDVVRDFTYFLSIAGRTNHMLAGLITSKDLIYFAVIVYIFLGFTILRLKGTRESRSFSVRAGRYVMVFISALLIGYVSSRPGMIGYLDVTVNKSNTLSPNARRIIKEMGDEGLEITVYNNLLGNYNFVGLPKERNNFLAFWERYVRFKPDITFHYVDYYDTSYELNYVSKEEAMRTTRENAELRAKNFSIDLRSYKAPEEIRQVIDLKPELNRYVMQLRYKGRTTFLRIFNDQRIFPSETEVCAALQRLLLARIPRIAFLTGNLERSIVKMGDREYENLTHLKTFRYALVNQGFDVDTLLSGNGAIPADISTLVIADPKSDLSPAGLHSVQEYIDRGGNLLITGEPGKQSVLNPLLKPLGVQLMDGIIVQQSKDFSPDLVLNVITGTAMSFSKALAYSAEDSVPVSMPGVTGLLYDAHGLFSCKPLLVTDARVSWLKKGKLVVDSADVIFSAAGGDVRKSLPTALALIRNIHGREQRIVITGDADFISNAEYGRNNVGTSNFMFNAALYSWLSNGAFPIDTSIPRGKDNRMKIGSATVAWCKVLFIWVLPAVIGIFGTILLIRRKRK